MKPIKVYFPDQVQSTINGAMGQEVLISPVEVQAELNVLLSKLVGEKIEYGPGGEPEPVAKTVDSRPSKYNLPTPVTLAQLLSQVKLNKNREKGYWYISGTELPGQSSEICVVRGNTFVELKLNQKVDISYKNEYLDKILQDLAGRSDADLDVTQGSCLHEYTLSVNMQNVPIKQAIMNVTAMVDAVCEFDWNSGGCNISIMGPGPKEIKATEAPPEPGAAPSEVDSGGYVGKISIPMDGGKYFIEFMLREKDLTEELRQLRAKKMNEVLGRSPRQERSKRGIEQE
jgi:hypothetical protein